MRPSDALKITGKPLAYFPQLAKPLGSVNASILFSHFFYWNDKGHSKLGIYRTADEIEAETGLSRDEQRTARAKLRKCGVLIETERRIEHRIYYKLDLAAFDELMCSQSGSREIPTPKSGNPNPEVGISQSGSREIPIVIRTEDLAVDLAVDYFVDEANLSGEKQNSEGLVEENLVEEKNQIADDGENIAEADSFTGAKAPALKSKVLKTKSAKSKSQYADNRKRFVAIVERFNAVFADCNSVQKVSLAMVMLENGKKVDTKINQDRMKLIPYAWNIAKQRVQEWSGTDGLIDGEVPNSAHCLQWFENYFRNCLKEGFINGEQPRSAMHENWRPKFENLLKPTWIEQRVFEGD